MEENRSEVLLSVVRSCLDEDIWDYDFNEIKGFFKFSVQLTHSTIKQASVIIDVKEDMFLIYGVLSVKADAEDENLIAELQDFICRANWEMSRGCFEIDARDGELRFRQTVNCEDAEVSADMIRDRIASAIAALNKYAEGFAGIMFGGLSPEDAMHRVFRSLPVRFSDSLRARAQKNYSEEIADSIRKFLDEDEWHYSFEEKSGHFSFGVNLKHQIKSVSYEVDVKENMYIVYLQSPIGVIAEDEDIMAKMKAFFGYANYNLLYGNFDLNMEDGNIRFKLSVDCSDMKPSTAIVRHSIVKPAFVFDRYADGIVSLIYSGASAQQAIEACEGDMDD